MRHDSAVIKAIASRYGLSTAKEIQSLPFFYMTPKAEKEFCDLTAPKNSSDNYQIAKEYIVSIDSLEVETLLPFHNFCIMIPDLGWFNIVYIKPGQFIVTLCADTLTADFIGKEVEGTLLSHMLTYNEIRRYPEKVSIEYEGNLTIAPLRIGEYVRYPSIEAQLKKINTNEEYAKHVLAALGQNIEYVLAYFKWAEGLHMTRVQKKPNKQDQKSEKHGDKKPWIRSDRPHYIYLDAPQTEADHPSNRTGERKPVRGHHRRAHWYTLRDPRFKNHPKYGIPQRKRATWVGPHEWTVKDTIYTVHTP